VAARTAVIPEKETAMPLGHSFAITPQEMEEIFVRLQPYLPRYLKKIDAAPFGGLRFEFASFTGREEEPLRPSTGADPKLSYIRESEDKEEHLLREKARVVLDNLYDAAQDKWRDAAYVADLKAAVKDAPGCWKTYQHEMKALREAYDYLRAPAAATEWRSAISRLIDAQDRTRAAAAAFDRRAEAIAEVHTRHLHSDLRRDDALVAAGYPQAKDWHITDLDFYRRNYDSEQDAYAPLDEQVRGLIERQDAHVAKVGRLSGATAAGR
jgi:hypothetical protein